MSQEQREEFLARVLAAHQAFYDIERDCTFAGKDFPAIAEFHTYGEQYVLVKRAKLWEVNTHDFMFFESMDILDEKRLQEEVAFITEKGIAKVNPGPNHMSSALSLVIVADECTDEARKLAKKTRFRKNYRLGLHGWTDLRLAVVDLSRAGAKSVVTNAAGKQLAKSLVGNRELVSTNASTK